MKTRIRQPISMDKFKISMLIMCATLMVGCKLVPTKEDTAQNNFKMCREELVKNHTDYFIYFVNNTRVWESGSIQTEDKYKLLTSTRYFEADKDKVPMITLLDAYSDCFNTFINDYEKVDPRYAALLNQWLSDMDDIQVQFMMKKINVSEYNKKLNDSEAVLQNDYLKIRDQIDDRNFKRNSRPRTSNWGDVYYDLAKKAGERKYTTCDVYGNSVDCTTW
jgi:hypothetical protein